MTQPRELVLLTKAQQVLAQASTVDEVKQLRDKAAAVRAYAQKARLGKRLVIEAATVRIRAERRLGQMLTETELANSAPGNQYTGAGQQPQTQAVLLKDLGITKNESSRSQRIAELPDTPFEQYLADCAETQREPTFASLFRLLRPESRTPPQGNSRPSTAASDGSTLLQIPDREYSTILAVPPWPGLKAPGQPSLSTDDLCELPVVNRLAQDSHLYLWTSSRFLVDGFDVMDAWGFAYQTSFVVVYEDAPPGTPWADAHHFLLAGVRGELPYRESSGPSWLGCKRTTCGFVPDDILKLIEAASPGPYLLLLGHQDALGEDWTSCPRLPEQTGES